MCGRAYITYSAEELEARYLTERLKRNPLPQLQPNWNLSPTQEVLVVRSESGRPVLEPMRWQFVPKWSEEFKTKLSTINAKSETVFESRLYQSAILKRRCIVPLSGFIEWRAHGSAPKRPFKIFSKEQSILSAAGIWETWRAGTDEERHSFAILTTSPNALMKKIHDRMPVFLSKSDEALWLDEKVQDPKAIAPLLKPCPAKWLEAQEISTAVNSPRNNRPEVLDPTGEVIEG